MLLAAALLSLAFVAPRSSSESLALLVASANDSMAAIASSADTTCYTSPGVKKPDCTCHSNCASCGYTQNRDPSRATDCTACKSGATVLKLYADGSGSCETTPSQQCVVALPVLLSPLTQDDKCARAKTMYPHGAVVRHCEEACPAAGKLSAIDVLSAARNVTTCAGLRKAWDPWFESIHACLFSPQQVRARHARACAPCMCHVHPLMCMECPFSSPQPAQPPLTSDAATSVRAADAVGVGGTGTSRSSAGEGTAAAANCFDAETTLACRADGGAPGGGRLSTSISAP